MYRNHGYMRLDSPMMPKVINMLTSNRTTSYKRRLFIASLLGFAIYYVLSFTTFYRSPRPDLQYEAERGVHRITKVSMLYGKPNIFYERALQTHRKHAQRWGYGMHVLHHDIAVGYWNKPSYLLSLLIQELAKPPSDRAEWLIPDQLAMALIFNQTEGGPEGRGYKENVVYLPRPWINTYEWSHAYEGKRGDMLVHFPGMQGERWVHMSNWLDIVEITPEKWEVPLEETEYLNRTREFWTQYRTARDAAFRAEMALEGQPIEACESTRAAISSLRQVLQEEADNPQAVRRRLEDLEAAVRWDQLLPN